MAISENMRGKVVTVSRYIMERERDFPHASGEFSNLLSDILLAGKLIHRQVTRAGLLDILGKTGDVNVQGEDRRVRTFAVLWAVPGSSAQQRATNLLHEVALKVVFVDSSEAVVKMVLP